MEVYLINSTTQHVVWSKVLLNNTEIAGMTNGFFAARAAKAVPVAAIPAHVRPRPPLMPAKTAAPPVSAPQTSVVWSQFYPVEVAPPGQTILLQINLAKPPVEPQQVEVQTKTGSAVRVNFRPRNYPQAQILGVTFSHDFRKLYVAHRLDDSDVGRDRSVQQVRLNGKDVTGRSQLFQQPQKDGMRLEGLIVIEPEQPVVQGDVVHLRLQFANAMVIQAMFRAWNGIYLDDFGVPAKDAKLRQQLGLDAEPAISPLTGDPACGDLLAGQAGHSVGPLLAARRKGCVQGDKRLSFPYLCTATSGNVHYSVYGQCADALQVNPYCLGWQATERFLETEEKRLRWGVQAARPRPCYWIPETFCYEERMLEASELRCMTYAVLGVGIKGIRYFIYGGLTGLKGYDQSPPLLAEIKKLNAEIKTLEPYLAPAIPMERETYDSKNQFIPEYDEAGCETTDQKYRVYTLWAGNEGLLILIRNLDYATDREPNALGLKPRFKHQPKRNIAVRIRKPSWWSAPAGAGSVAVRDLLGPETPSASVVGDQIQFTVSELDLTRAFWIPNAQPKPRP